MAETPEEHISMGGDCGSQIIEVRPDESVSQPRSTSTDDPSSEIGGSSRLSLVADVILIPLLSCCMILGFEREMLLYAWSVTCMAVHQSDASNFK